MPCQSCAVEPVGKSLFHARKIGDFDPAYLGEFGPPQLAAMAGRFPVVFASGQQMGPDACGPPQSWVSHGQERTPPLWKARGLGPAVPPA